MAFPTGYTKYQEITIDNTKVTADLTDYVVYVDLSDLDKAGSDIFDTCLSDGGDIRITKSDGTTELAREIVEIDTTAKTGGLHFKYTGTLSSSTDTVVRIWYNGTDAEPAVDATYGRNAVWSDYIGVWHLNTDPTSSLIDSTGNGHNGTSAGSMTSGDVVAGKIGNALDFDGTDDYIAVPDHADLDSASGNLSISYWGNRTTSGVDGFVWKKGTGNTNGLGWGDYYNTDTAGWFRCDDGTNDIYVSLAITNGSWQLHHQVVDRSANISTYLNGATDGAAKSATALGSMANSYDLWFMRSILGTAYMEGKLQEVRVSTNALSSNWISTEYNNQNSPSTFYSTGDEISSGSTATEDANFFGVNF